MKNDSNRFKNLQEWYQARCWDVEREESLGILGTEAAKKLRQFVDQIYTAGKEQEHKRPG